MSGRHKQSTPRRDCAARLRPRVDEGTGKQAAAAAVMITVHLGEGRPGREGCVVVFIVATGGGGGSGRCGKVWLKKGEERRGEERKVGDPKIWSWEASASLNGGAENSGWLDGCMGGEGRCPEALAGGAAGAARARAQPAGFVLCCCCRPTPICGMGDKR